MRAGLLSNPEVIKIINSRFVTTWAIYDELLTKKEKGDAWARVLADNHEYPLDFMFFSPDGKKLIARLTSFKDLPSAHEDVAHPQRGGKSHFDVFMSCVRKHFGE